MLYITQIPKAAEEEISSTYPSGMKRSAAYKLSGEIVGRRNFAVTGDIISESAYQNGKQTGTAYEWNASGALVFLQSYVDGAAHGFAYQWSDVGNLIGCFAMDYGTGIDAWWSERDAGQVFLKEVRYMVKGQMHGVEWWINNDQVSISSERAWDSGVLHGLAREWEDGRLRVGFPRYYIHGTEVSPQEYADSDVSALPHFSASDDSNIRLFPDKVKTLMRSQFHSTAGT